MAEKYFKGAEEWHQWLGKNHNKVDELWLIYYKKHTGVPSISYEDAVLEALSFGWIDGVVNRIDENKYKQRFTPRRKGSVWSQTNLNRVKKLIAEGRMTPAGLKAAQDVLSGKQKPEPGHISDDVTMPKELELALKKDNAARQNFAKFPPSTQKIFFYWIISAKQAQTKERRIVQTLKAAKENNKFGYTGINKSN